MKSNPENVVYSNLPEHVVNELNVRKKDLEDLQKNDSLNLSTTAIQMTQLSQMSMQPTSNLPHHRALHLQTIVTQFLSNERVKKVVGVELCKAAVEDAKRNAELNNQGDTAHFFAAKAEAM